MSLRFLKEVYYAYQGCIYLIKNTILMNFKIQFIPVMAKLNFQHHSSSRVSHDPSEIILLC